MSCRVDPRSLGVAARPFCYRGKPLPRRSPAGFVPEGSPEFRFPGPLFVPIRSEGTWFALGELPGTVETCSCHEPTEIGTLHALHRSCLVPAGPGRSREAAEERMSSG